MLNFRKTSEVDRPNLQAWIAQDSDHKDRCTPDFWMPTLRATCFAVGDQKGPLFYTRGEVVLRLHIQFCPLSERRRLVVAIHEFTEWIKKQSANNFRQIVFESTSEPLIKFLEKRGFRRSANEIVVDL